MDLAQLEQGTLVTGSISDSAWLEGGRLSLVLVASFWRVVNWLSGWRLDAGEAWYESSLANWSSSLGRW